MRIIMYLLALIAGSAFALDVSEVFMLIIVLAVMMLADTVL